MLSPSCCWPHAMLCVRHAVACHVCTRTSMLLIRPHRAHVGSRTSYVTAGHHLLAVTDALGNARILATPLHPGAAEEPAGGAEGASGRHVLQLPARSRGCVARRAVAGVCGRLQGHPRTRVLSTCLLVRAGAQCAVRVCGPSGLYTQGVRVDGPGDEASGAGGGRPPGRRVCRRCAAGAGGGCGSAAASGRVRVPGRGAGAELQHGAGWGRMWGWRREGVWRAGVAIPRTAVHSLRPGQGRELRALPAVRLQLDCAIFACTLLTHVFASETVMPQSFAGPHGAYIPPAGPIRRLCGRGDGAAGCGGGAPGTRRGGASRPG